MTDILEDPDWMERGRGVTFRGSCSQCGFTITHCKLTDGRVRLAADGRIIRPVHPKIVLEGGRHDGGQFRSMTAELVCDTCVPQALDPERIVIP